MKVKIKILVAVVFAIGVLQVSAQQRENKLPSIEERVSRITQHLGKEIKLSDSEIEVIESAYINFFKTADNFMQPGERPKKEVIEKHENVRDEKINKANLKIDTKEDYLFVKSEYKIRRINLIDILYIEGLREYVKIVLKKERPVLSLMSLKSLEENLPEDRFMRVHRSFIVSLDEINTVERSRIIFDKTYIPVSDQYKEKFQDFLVKRFI